MTQAQLSASGTVGGPGSKGMPAGRQRQHCSSDRISAPAFHVDGLILRGDLQAGRLAGVDLVSVRWLRNLALGVAAITVAGCGGSPGRVGPPPPAAWVVVRHLPGVVDLAGPRSDGSFLVAAAGRLLVLGRDGTLSPFARGAGGYLTATGTEPYLVLTSSDQVRGTRCSFGNDTAFAIEPGARPGVIMISPQGRARRFASLPPGRSLSGIAFDGTGRFGHRLLVTAGSGGRTTVFGIGCDGRVSTVAAGAPAVEGGMVVAPASVRQLRRRPHRSGRGQRPGLRRGPGRQGRHHGAVGPAGRRRHRRGVRRVRARREHPPCTSLTASRRATGIQATTPSCSYPRRSWRGPESGPATCSSPPRAAPGPSTSAARHTCTVRYVAAGPAIAHAEGHVVFASS